VLKCETKGETPDGTSEMPVLVTIHGIPFWQASGRTFPVVAGAEDPPPAGANTEDPPKPKEGEGSGDDDFDKPRAMATIKQLRDREKAMRDQLKELDALKAKQKERDDAEKTEAERLKGQLAEAEQKRTETERQLQEVQRRRAIERAASKAGAQDADDVYRLIDQSKLEDDLSNADKLVEALLKDKPYLKGKTTDGVPGTPRGNGNVNHSDRVKDAEEKLIATRQYTPIG
jgi:hypothetical protein